MIVFKKPYIYGTIGIFVLYIIINLSISGFYNTIPLLVKYSSTLSWAKLSTSIILTIIIAFLVSLTAVYTFIKFKERQRCINGATAASVGTIGGLLVGVCPLCITGLFPLIFSLVGVSLSFASLPLQGIEIQILIIIILTISLWILNRTN